MDILKNNFERVYSILLTIVVICYVWYQNSGGTVNIAEELAPENDYGLIVYLIIRFTPNKTNQLIQELIEKYKNNAQIENEKSLVIINRIENSRNKFVSTFPSLSNLWDSFIEARVTEIENSHDGNIEFESEVQRESFITKLFEHLESIPNLRLIQSVTWDYEGYFPDYWRHLSRPGKFEERNEKALKCNVKIQRLFIFRKHSMSAEKKEIYHDLVKQNQKTLNTEMKWVFEEDLLESDFNRYKKERSSFLLLIDRDDKVRVITQNFQVEKIADQKKSIAKFFTDGHFKIELQNRFVNLYSPASNSELM